MPKYNLRSWAEQTLFDSRDYIVTADSLAEAVELLEQVQEDAEYGDKRIEHSAIVAFDKYQLDGVGVLDPCDVIDGSGGITLLDRKGERARDLIGVPTGCVRLGEPLEPAELEPAELEPADDGKARLIEASRALLAWGCEHTGPRQANSPHDLLVELQAALRAAGVAI
jgi:hypothetical protein